MSTSDRVDEYSAMALVGRGSTSLIRYSRSKNRKLERRSQKYILRLRRSARIFLRLSAIISQKPNCSVSAILCIDQYNSSLCYYIYKIAKILLLEIFIEGVLLKML